MDLVDMGAIAALALLIVAGAWTLVETGLRNRR